MTASELDWVDRPGCPGARARAMRGLSSNEAAAVERCAGRADARPGRGLGGGQQRLAQPRRPRRDGAACSPTPSRRCPASSRWRDPAPVEAIGADGSARAGRRTAATSTSRCGPRRRCSCCFTGHMDTVFGADHPFQQRVLARGRACSAAPASPT